ncbi:DNA-binding MarR family transcriptional regulator [Dysgonomonas sp. PFB1-18]|jgi:DNA-binding MarR family transcriptional regulator|uniref:MarR family winged helix-turn-helix transcriptional regulator n=1 Tax=unclassified Dysgonomonas TaxID=2630389 RepID=UPI0024750557|nr:MULTISPECIES: MarR family transcriptional regulator [unclassified Dysgonomonas]MDH6308278.1 DNA-binding MarR family transcriptional regulator [Dysgonomonas sp. PF1-14]MDH6338284.1 DNA-binding MarR family transcriptional regulator [Dysgonomonas sp. PF1-16]MDH6379781.1 DNA-binding MarR family transcriptional regulator [Dysgonomonas sp. PFB1-18]MDH6397129.1 DNA-binding MarR family transcriptional regulator [Dysgonomonas sp. PF1-23]
MKNEDILDLNQDQDLIFPIINGKVSMAINRMMYRNFRREGLDITPEQWTVLAFLWKEDGVTQQTLCNSTFKDKPSMTRLIDNLTKQNLVYRNASTSDRRSNYIFLTELGRSIKDKANKAVYETMDAALAGIDEEGLKQVRFLLAAVFGNIQDALSER